MGGGSCPCCPHTTRQGKQIEQLGPGPGPLVAGLQGQLHLHQLQPPPPTHTHALPPPTHTHCHPTTQHSLLPHARCRATRPTPPSPPHTPLPTPTTTRQLSHSSPLAGCRATRPTPHSPTTPSSGAPPPPSPRRGCTCCTWWAARGGRAHGRLGGNCAARHSAAGSLTPAEPSPHPCFHCSGGQLAAAAIQRRTP